MSLLSPYIKTAIAQGWVKTDSGGYVLFQKYSDWVTQHDKSEWTYNRNTGLFTMSEHLEMMFLLRWS